jgi:hypothetical protein
MWGACRTPRRTSGRPWAPPWRGPSSSQRSAFLQGIEDNPAIPPQVSSQATVELASGVPFTSDADLQAALQEAGVGPDATAAALEVNKEARLAGLRAAIAVLALIALSALFFTGSMPTRVPGRSRA